MYIEILEHVFSIAYAFPFEIPCMEHNFRREVDSETEYLQIFKYRISSNIQM